MSFPLTPILDTFDRADESPITGWSNGDFPYGAVGVNGYRVVSNQLRPIAQIATGTYGTSTYGPGAEQYATFPEFGSSSHTYYDFIQNPGTTYDGYFASLRHDGFFTMGRYDNGADTILVSSTISGVGNGVRIGGRISYTGRCGLWVRRTSDSEWWEVAAFVDTTYTGSFYLNMFMDGKADATQSAEDYGGGAVEATYIRRAQIT